MRKHKLGAILTLATLALLASPALGATLKVGKGKSFSTIQDAVDEASDGDRILVFQGVYEENVSFDTTIDRLQFIAKGRVVWDGGDREGDACLDAIGNDIKVQGFIFRNGNDCVAVEGDGTVITRCRFRGNGEDHIDLEGDDVRVENCRFRASNRRAIFIEGNGARIQRNNLFGVLDEFDDDLDAAIMVVGFGTVIQRNTIKNVDHRGIVVHPPETMAPLRKAGDGAQILNNRVTNTQHDGIRIGRGTENDEELDEVILRGNRVTSSEEDLVEIDGDGAIFERNTLRNGRDQLLDLDGDDATVRFNRCNDSTDGEGISVEGHDATVTDNFISNTRRESIEVRGDGCEILRNRCTNSFEDDGIQVVALEEWEPADGGTVANNVIADCAQTGLELWINGATVQRNRITDVGRSCSDGHGLSLNGDGGAVDRNTVLRAVGTGIVVEGDGIDLDRNTVIDCLLNGYFIDGGSNDVTLTRCVARLCDAEGIDNAGTDTTATGCTFLGNRLDVAGEPGSYKNEATFEQDNKYVTGGPTTEQEIGCENPFD